MPLFICDRCKAVENTALGFYWARRVASWADPQYNGQALCSECTPTTYHDGSQRRDAGKWHGQFDKQIADAPAINKIGRDRFVYTAGL